MVGRLISVVLSLCMAYVAWLVAGMLFHDGNARMVVGILAALACISGGGYFTFRQ